MSELSFVIVTYGHKKCQIDVLINSLLCQTDPGWVLYLWHDGPNDEVRRWVEDYNDPRIHYRENPINQGYWGHPMRTKGLVEVTSKWVTWGNADNYYTPVYVEWMKEHADRLDLNILLCKTLHNYPQVNGPGEPPYILLDSRFGLNGVDWISFIMKTETAKEVGLNHDAFTGADGMLIEDTKTLFAQQNRELRWDKLQSALSVHN